MRYILRITESDLPPIKEHHKTFGDAYEAGICYLHEWGVKYPNENMFIIHTVDEKMCPRYKEMFPEKSLINSLK